MKRVRVVLTLALGTFLLGLPAAAQERQRSPFAALEALNASYERHLRDLECRRIADLAALAEKATDPVADAAYQQMFGLAIARGLCPEAQPAAARCLKSASRGRDVRALATLVQVLARTDKGEHDRALEDWKALLHGGTSSEASVAPLGSECALAVGEAYLQRLIRDGRYDVARKLCDLACLENAPAEVKDHFEDRMARLDLIGKPAPPIAGTDVDGHPVSLAQFKGKVVLVDFWATWCPPCVASIPSLNSLAQKYNDKGFVILGVNVDAMHEDVEANKVLPLVRQFLVKHRVTWTNMLNGQGNGDFAPAYRVEQIPANFLVGRDGRISAVDQNGEMLEQVLVRVLGNKAIDDAK
jgi:thiol-disulfide isomerase/thioredoxin